MHGRVIVMPFCSVTGLPGIGIEAFMSKAQVTMMTIIILSVLAAMNPLMYNLSAWIGLKVSVSFSRGTGFIVDSQFLSFK